jgi:hypothetical protein
MTPGHVYSVYEIKGPDGLYVGSCAVTPAQRWSNHKSYALRSRVRSPIYLAMRKHGVAAFRFAVVAEFDSLAKSRRAETALIRRYARAGVRLYNATRKAGGRIGSHGKALA